MLIFPAIDLRGGRVVRLTEGDYARETVYDSDPVFTAEKYLAAGAQWLHVVDLDAARDGGQVNFEIIRRLVGIPGLRIEVGGGARSEDSARKYLDAGVDRVILGTAAVEQPELLEKLAAKYPGKIAAGVDARDGFVAIHGWRTVTDLDAFVFISSMPARGVDTVIYTDIARDGLLSGPNFAAYEKLYEIKGLNVVASGGVTTEQDIKKLARMKLYAAIVGKALYDGRIDVETALRAAKEGEA